MARTGLADIPPPTVRFRGDAGTSPLATAMCQAFYQAIHGQSRLPPRLYEVDGFSGRKFRMFLNNLFAAVASPRYLEIGVFQGGSFLPAIHGHAMAATGVDNWSWPRANLPKFRDYLAELAGGVDVTILDLDFRAVDFAAIGPFNVVFYDGSHEEIDQFDGVKLTAAAMDDSYIVIVDDWNWPRVRKGTFEGLAAAGCGITASLELFTSLDGGMPPNPFRGMKSDWHNGMFAAVVERVLPRAGLGTRPA